MKAAVLLAGCGHRDGSEVQEATLALLALSQCGFATRCFSLDEPQAQVMDHLTGKPAAGARNMLLESARIARGQIEPLRGDVALHYDVLVIPGGFGVAYNLCDFAEQQQGMSVHPKVETLISSFYAAKKPIGAICIAPVLLAKTLGRYEISVTTGNAPEVAAVYQAWGAKHVQCEKSHCVVDHEHRIVTTPAYMYDDTTIAEVYAGIHELAKALQSMCTP